MDVINLILIHVECQTYDEKDWRKEDKLVAKVDLFGRNAI